MKRKLLIGMVLVLVALLLSACGIPQEDYDAVVAERDAAQAKTASVESDLSEARNKIGTLEGDLNTAQEQVDRLNQGIADAQTEIEALQSKLDSAQASSSKLSSRVSSLEARIPTLEYGTHTDTDLGFSIDYPQGWDEEEMEDIDAFYVAPGKPVNMAVMHVELEELMSAQAYFNELRSALQGQGYALISGLKEITVDGMTAMRGIYVLEDIEQMYVVLVKGKTAWTIFFTARRHDFIDYAHTFGEVVDSFKLTQ